MGGYLNVGMYGNTKHSYSTFKITVFGDVHQAVCESIYVEGHLFKLDLLFYLFFIPYYVARHI